MPSNRSLEKIRLLRLLREEFLAKTGQQSVGTGTIREELARKVKAARGNTLQAASTQTIKQYLDRPVWPTSMEPGLVEQFLIYLAYQNWQDFSDRHQEMESGTEEVANVASGRQQIIERDGSTSWNWGP